MVTFSLPGDEVAESSNATPRSRPMLGFAKRAYAPSPYGSASKRLGTSQNGSARKTLTTRDDVPASSLSRSFAGPSNIFRSSTISDSPPRVPFSPSLSQTPMKRVFAPGATPEPTRVQRETTAQATPRGVAAKAKDKDLFPMRIASPPRELTGEALTQKVPKDWDPKGSIYADQFLSHLCPAEFDDEQRRQFFCILDLRRLKYAADEIFCKKGWKLNVLNFAKEFEKSRSIIMLHYGLYEFQNVKPSKDLIKRWRREHGLPALEDDEAEATPSPSKATSAKKKRKATDEGTDEIQGATSKSKRRATEKDEVEEVSAAPTSATPVLGKNKRKASFNEDAESQPSKVQKQPSGARSLFEKAANKTSTTSPDTSAKPNTFAPKPSNNSLFQSVLKNNAKSDASQQAAGGNIFGHLSDNSSKNSGQEADAESETDSEPAESPENAQSDEPSAKRPALPPNVPETGTSSAAGTRESTPGRSLFDRVTKDGEGQLVRAATPTEAPATAKDQTWNPSTTPIKFAPAPTTTTASTDQGSSLFGNSAPTPAPTSTASMLFGAPKQDKPAEKETGKAAEEADKDGGESDKENDSQGPNKSLPEPKPAPEHPSFGSSLFQSKPTSAEPAKEAEPAKPAATSNIFSASASKPASESSNVFGAASKPAESTTPPTSTVMTSSTLFGAKATGTEPPKPAFGAPTTTSASNDTTSSAPLFGAKPASTTSNLFGNNTAAAKPLFGNASSTSQEAATATVSAPASSASTFSFGSAPAGDAKSNGISQPASTPLFGAPKSPPATTGANSMFDGSPMKQDDKSPAKPAFGDGNNAASAPSFNFGGASQTASTSNIFENASKPPADNANGGVNFGGALGNSSAPAGGFNFNFSAGGSDNSSGTAFNNPFASGNNAAAGVNSNTGGTFSFGAGSSGPSTGGMFQFGGSGTGNSTPSGGPFGANQASTNGAPAFGGGSSAPSSGSMFNFGASQAQTNTGSGFGNNQNSAAPAFNLQPPSGGPSTGTNTPSILGGGSSLATTPARGTPEPSSQAEGGKGGENEEGEKQEQINLTEGAEEGEDTLHEVRAKVLKFVPADKSEGEEKPKSKSPWSTQGVGCLRLLKNKETDVVRLLLRAEPRGHVAMNRAVLPDLAYKADEKYIKMTTSNDQGDGLETWMIQVKTKDLAKELAEALETNKGANKK